MSYFIEYDFFPDKDENNYKIRLNKANRAFKSLREEIELALILKANSINKPICALLSGGKDSQAMIVSLLDCKIPFDCTHLAQTYKGNLVTAIFAWRSKMS